MFWETTGLVWMISFPLAVLLSLPVSVQEISREESKDFCWRYNPISFYFYILPCGIIRHTLSVIRAIGRFIKTFFILIHSEMRLLCGVDAAIGAGIGYFYGNPILGMLFGGLFGVLNYEVVSKRLLRLPSKE
jgi:hypothetical protein